MKHLEIVLFWCLIPAIFAYNGKGMKRSRETSHIDNIKKYEFYPPITRFCDTLRSDKHFRFGEESLNFMQLSTHYATTQDKICTFTCNEKSNAKLNYFQGKIVPPEVKTFQATPTLHEVIMISHGRIIFATLEKDFNLLEPYHHYMSDLAAMDFKLNDQGHRTDYLAVNVNLYNVQLSSGIEPTQEIWPDFKSFPDLTPEKILQYYQFIMSDGTHLHLGTFLGGGLRVLVSSASPKGKEQTKAKFYGTNHTSTTNEVLAMQIGTNKNTAVFSTK